MSSNLPLKKLQTNPLSRKWDRLIFWYSFFMAFPALVLVQNVSVYIFLSMTFFIIKHSAKPLLTLEKPIQWIAFFFGLGALLSVVNIPNTYSEEAIGRAMVVLPNYLYWSILIIMLVTHRKYINFDTVHKGIFWGVTVSLVYVLFLQKYLVKLPVFYVIASNSFSFLLICYTPSCLFFLKKKKGYLWATSYLFFLILIQLFDGRRAGTGLVALVGSATLYFTHFNWKQILFASIAVVVGYTLVYTPLVEKIILNSNERIYEIVYDTDKVLKEDRSYLFRIAMVNKGLTIFNEYKLTGIGLNNFKNYKVEVSNDFEGAEYVVYKKKFNELSSHNSYINILAEGGLFLFIPFVGFFIYFILFFIFNFRKIHELHRPFYIAVVGMAVHLYFIAAIVNVYAWFLIALAASASVIPHIRKYKVAPKS